MKMDKEKLPRAGRTDVFIFQLLATAELWHTHAQNFRMTTNKSDKTLIRTVFTPIGSIEFKYYKKIILKSS